MTPPPPSPPRGKIICADARHLCRYVEPGSVSLTVTSPPYRNAIDSRQHVDDLESMDKKWMRGTGTTTTTGAYLDDMEAIFGQVLEATRPGGFCAIAIGDEVVNGKLIPLPSLIASRIASTENGDDPSVAAPGHHNIAQDHVGQERGGQPLRRVHKVPAPRMLSGQHNARVHPGPPKGGRPPRRARRCCRCRARRRRDPPQPSRQARDRKLRMAHLSRPAPNGRPSRPFPEQIPWRLITLLTKRGDLVLDPMNGSGQTTTVARSLGRRYAGLDIEAAYVGLARSRLGDGLRLSDNLVQVFHKESWHDGGQSGLFETERVDLSANIPAGYMLEFWTEQGGASREGGGGMRACYRDSSGPYLCFVIAASGRQSRLSLGQAGDEGSMLHGLLKGLPDVPFISAPRRRSMPPWSSLLKGLPDVPFTRADPEGCPAEDRRQAGACLDVLVRDGLVEGPGAAGGRRRPLYGLTGRGRRQGASRGRQGQ